MTSEIYALKDVVLGAFKAPFLQQNRAVAMRTARWLAEEGDKTKVQDNALYQLGVYDDESGMILPLSNGPEYVCDIEGLKS